MTNKNECNNVPSSSETPKKLTAGESSSCWNFPPICIIKIAEFLEKAKSYAHHLKENGHFEICLKMKDVRNDLMGLPAAGTGAQKKTVGWSRPTLTKMRRLLLVRTRRRKKGNGLSLSGPYRTAEHHDAHR